MLLRIAAFLLVLVVSSAPVLAQNGGEEAEVSAPPGLGSPAETMRTFLEAMHAEERDRAVECLDLTNVPPDAAWDLASKLNRCLNRIEYVDFDLLPGAGNMRVVRDGRYQFYPPDRLHRREAERLADKQVFRYERVLRLAPEAVIALTRGSDGAWKFSAPTIAGIGDLYDRLSGLSTVEGIADEPFSLSLWIESQWPVSLQAEVLGVEQWQWISIFILLIVGLLLDLVVRVLVASISRRVIVRRGGEANRETLRRTVRPFGMAAAAILWLWAIGRLGLPPIAWAVLGPCVKLYVMLALVWSAWRLTDLVGEVLSDKAETTESKFDDLVVPLVRKAFKILIGIFGLIYIANSMHIEIAPLLTGLGIGGVGFAFAAKDTLENFFGSITVIIDRPFQIGDWVTIGDTEGTVEELNLRSVRIRTFYNSLVTIPTANLVRAAVDNYGQRKYRRWKTHLNVTYSTPPDSIDAFCEGIREIIRLHPYTRKDYYQVWLHQFGSHSLDVLVYMFFEAPEWSTELRERHRVMLDIIRLADRLGVDFAFPTQTLHMYQEDADAEHIPADAPERSTRFRSQITGRRAVRDLTENAAWRDHKPAPYRFAAPGEDIDMDAASDGETQIESKVGGDA